MGMAASQARYLALTARKTNTEWEGQQINQARTALANQSANLFNRLLGLEVPNPPSKTDYTELQYSYSDGDNDSVIDKWEKLSTTDPNYNYVVKHYYMADIFTGSQRQLKDPQVQMGDVLKKIDYDPNTTSVIKNGEDITVTYKIYDKTEEQPYEKITQTKIDQDAKLESQLRNFETAMDFAKDDGTLNTDAVYGYQDTDGTWHFFIANETEATTQAANLNNALKDQGYIDESGYITPNLYGKQDVEGNWTFKIGATAEDIANGYSEITIDAATPYMKAYDNKDYSTVYGPSYVGNSKLTELYQLGINPQTSIEQAAELAQILRDCPDSNMKQYVSFDTEGNLVYTGSGIYTFDINGKSYYTTKADLMNSVSSPYTANMPIDIQANLPYYSASMVSKRIEQTNQALLETDQNGRFTSVKFDNDSNTYHLNVEQVTNEAAYEDAMNKYLYKKAEYEKTIADINAKTSIIQQEDRTLELRLKQLDTEQNALATEMDAVKKVIKDNVEKTFKTFSD